MDLITGLFNMDFAALVPEMNVLMGIEESTGLTV